MTKNVEQLVVQASIKENTSERKKFENIARWLYWNTNHSTTIFILMVKIIWHDYFNLIILSSVQVCRWHQFHQWLKVTIITPVNQTRQNRPFDNTIARGPDLPALNYFKWFFPYLVLVVKNWKKYECTTYDLRAYRPHIDLHTLTRPHIYTSVCRS